MASPIIEKARKEQERLRKGLLISSLDEGKVGLLCGVDVSYLGKREDIFSAAVLFSYPAMEVLEEVYTLRETSFPYIPGYLAFREVPTILDSLKKMEGNPDLIICDGHGIAHPRGFGLASHLGVVKGVPTIGIAKKKLVGEYGPPGEEKGASSPLIFEGKRVGTVLRTRGGVKPVFVSPGHLTDIESSLYFARTLTGKYRIVEPIRRAHQLTVKVRKELMKGSHH
jgi:deoxyribonuclease V